MVAFVVSHVGARLCLSASRLSERSKKHLPFVNTAARVHGLWQFGVYVATPHGGGEYYSRRDVW